MLEVPYPCQHCFMYWNGIKCYFSIVIVATAPQDDIACMFHCVYDIVIPLSACIQYAPTANDYYVILLYMDMPKACQIDYLAIKLLEVRLIIIIGAAPLITCIFSYFDMGKKNHLLASLIKSNNSCIWSFSLPFFLRIGLGGGFFLTLSALFFRMILYSLNHLMKSAY